MSTARAAHRHRELRFSLPKKPPPLEIRVARGRRGPMLPGGRTSGALEKITDGRQAERSDTRGLEETVSPRRARALEIRVKGHPPTDPCFSPKELRACSVQ